VKPDFSPEELRLLRRARQRTSRDSWGMTLVLLPFAAFAAYGMWRMDAIAVFIAWAGSFGWLAWWIVASVRSSATLAGILKKYDEAARTDGDREDGVDRR
jgi:hypothetical protein